jgi:hypothetical protein
MTKRHEVWKLCLIGLLASVATCGPLVWELVHGPLKQNYDAGPYEGE